MDINERNVKRLVDAAEMLWITVANVNQGDWKLQTEEWQTAAAQWRDEYFKSLEQLGITKPAEENK